MLILCVFVYENSKRDIWTENRATWRENNGKANRGHDHWTPVDVEPHGWLWCHCDQPPC